MIANHNDIVAEHFALKSRDWTPLSMRQTATVLYVPLSNNREITKRCRNILSVVEHARADSFVTQPIAAHFIQRRAFRRYCGALALKSKGVIQPLSEIGFEETEKGRPYLPDLPDFNFSFSAAKLGFLGAWSETHKVGVDIEDRLREVEAFELAQRFFSKAEANLVEGCAGDAQLRTFYQLWCLKEAALKSIGEGLPFGLDAFEFALTPDLGVVEAPIEFGGRERFEAQLIEQGKICAALVIQDVN